MSEHRNVNLGPIILGLLLGGIFTTVLFTQTASPQYEHIVIVFILGSVLGLIAGYCYSNFEQMAKQGQHEQARREYEQSLPPKPPSQIVGRKCFTCATSIIFQDEGTFCQHCFEPFCIDCKNSAES